MNIPQFFGDTPVTEVWLLNCSSAVTDRVDETIYVKQLERYSLTASKNTETCVPMRTQV